MNIGGSISGALFSEDNRFRFALWRIWDDSLAALLFIGLNPSRAGDVQDDPTVRRLIGFAKSWGYGGLFVANLSAFVTPDPKELWPCLELSKTMNDAAIKLMRILCGAAVVGWGHFGKDAGTRPAEVLALIGKPVYCMGTTKDGEPKHPLYLRADTQMKLYERGTL